MLWVPQKGKVRADHNLGAVGTATPGTAVTTGGAATTKGTPAQLIASTAVDCHMLWVQVSDYGTSGGASQLCVDILVGASTEEVLIANLLAGYPGDAVATNTGPKTWMFPLYVPAGTRIAAQAAGTRVNTACRVAVAVYNFAVPPFRVGGKVTSYGITTVPAGTTISAGASGATGAWAEVTASTTSDHFAFVPSFQAGGGETALTNRVLYVDMGIGAATEELLNPVPYVFYTDTFEKMCGPMFNMPAFQDVPSGTRLVMRASNSGTNDAYNGIVHALS